MQTRRAGRAHVAPSTARKWWGTGLAIGAAALVGLVSAQPLLTAGGRLPWAADTLIHLYRLVELDHLLRQGYFFSRWTPDLVYGFGFPLFNFYAPLCYYVAEIFRVVGLDFAPAVVATFAALAVAAGIAMYAWTAALWGRRAGLVSAAAYVTAPYFLYNLYHRGALAEVLAMALMPAASWSATRLVHSSERRFFVLAALTCAGIALSHNITALVFTPLLVLYVAWMALARAERLDAAVIVCGGRAMLAIVLGLGLSAFFWIPMFFERDSVQIIQLFLPAAFDYRLNFVVWQELFSLPVAADPNLILPPTPHSIGVIPFLLAIGGCWLGWRRGNRPQKAATVFAGVAAIASVFFILPVSRPVWDAASILRFVQFPWRFLGLASLALAFLSGSVFSWLARPRLQVGLIAVVIGGMIVYGFTWQYVPFLDPIVRPKLADIARYERETGAIGTTSAGDYLPVTVKKLPPSDRLVERYARSDVIERLDVAALPPSARVLEAEYRPLASTATLESQFPLTVTLDIFYFPGWQARVDGAPVAITPTDPHGLISFPVPAGRHQLSVTFGSTPLRTAAELVSWVSVLMLLVASVVLPAGKPSDSSGADVRLDWRAPAAVVIVVAGLFAWKTLDLDGRETLFRRTRFDGGQVTGLAHPLNVNFDHRLALMGYEPAALAAEVGGALSVSLYWRALQPLDADYSISAQLVDERGWVYGQRDSQHPGGYPTSRWKTSGYARDVHEITLLPGTPPGRYRLRVGVYRVGVPGGLNVLDANGAPAGTSFDVAIVQVNRRGWSPFPPQLARPQPQHASGAQLAPGLVLIGYDLPLGEIQAGANLPFTLYWRSGGDNPTPFPLRELDAQLELVGLDETVRLGRVAPISPQFPTSNLHRGDVVRGPSSIRTPAFTPGGNWTVRLALVDQGGVAQGDVVDLGRVTVQVPARTMVMPPVQYPLAATPDPVRLAGYDVSHASLAPGATLTVTLYWQAQREMTTSAKSFVHLLDASGRLVAGSDAIPANWTRPTTGWIAGEYVTDPHAWVLPRDLAPGAYRLEVGLYDATSGERLGEGIVLDHGVMVTRP